MANGPIYLRSIKIADYLEPIILMHKNQITKITLEHCILI